MRRRTDYGIILAHVFGWSVAFAALALAVLAWAAMARAHQAPSGWAYDVEQHPMAQTPLAGFLAHGSPMLRPSGDGQKHVCTDGRRIICVYVPPGGV